MTEPAAARRTFRELADLLPDLLDRLLACPPVLAQVARFPDVPAVYLFSSTGVPQYVGQTRRLGQRIGQHRRASSAHNQASFAFLMARGLAGSRHADLVLPRTRSGAEAEPRFAALFLEAKAEVRAMDVRHLVVPDAVLRTLLEVYAAVELRTPHNSFETH